MSVSKRTRYEVLRRDNNTCRYCGGKAPDVTLTIDHVTPVSLGGSDDPSNLVAACKDCNAGKSSSNPDAPLVAAVSDDAVRWAAALKAAAAAAVADLHAADDYIEQFYDTWDSCMSQWARLSDDWEDSVRRWHSLGLPIELLEKAVRKASAPRVSNAGKFSYMAGVAWSELTEIQTAAKASLSDSTGPTHCNHGCPPEGCMFLDDEDGCPHCGEPACLYLHGEFAGQDYAWREVMRRFGYRDRAHQMLERVIDGAA